MGEAEQRERMGRMLTQVQRYDIGYWTRHVLARFAKLSEAPAQPVVWSRGFWRTRNSMKKGTGRSLFAVSAEVQITPCASMASAT